MTKRTRERRQTALITGASAGIGRELAATFASHGFDLVVAARRRHELETLAASLRATHHVSVSVVAIDLATSRAPRLLFETVQRRGIDVDVLVNNAGVTFHGDFQDIPLENHLSLIELNIRALTALTRLYVPRMVERGHGRVLNVASVSAFQPVPTIAVYAASKAYVLSFSEALSIELAGTGVTVTAICPGLTKTPMVQIESATTGHPPTLPDFAVSDPAEVAREAYDACMRGEAVQISGWMNQIAALWMQHQPRWLGRTVGGWIRSRG